MRYFLSEPALPIGAAQTAETRSLKPTTRGPHRLGSSLHDAEQYR